MTTDDPISADFPFESRYIDVLGSRMHYNLAGLHPDACPVLGWVFISGLNFFINRIMPQSVVRPLTEAELDQYRAPYPTAASRKPVRQRPSEVPKLLLHTKPGGITTPEVARWCETTTPNLSAVDVGEGIHYLQEDNQSLHRGE